MCSYSNWLCTGVKFNDADLIGIPIRLTVGSRGLANGQVEMKLRHENDRSDVPLDQVVERAIDRARAATQIFGTEAAIYFQVLQSGLCFGCRGVGRYAGWCDCVGCFAGADGNDALLIREPIENRYSFKQLNNAAYTHTSHTQQYTHRKAHSEIVAGYTLAVFIFDNELGQG